MPSTPTFKLSMLDLVAVREGASVGQALDVARQTVQHAERLGFSRYWVAEHHNMTGIASSATAVLVGHLAGATSRIDPCCTTSVHLPSLCPRPARRTRVEHSSFAGC